MARQQIRIKLKAYDHRLIDQSARQIVEAAEGHRVFALDEGREERGVGVVLELPAHRDEAAAIAAIALVAAAAVVGDARLQPGDAALDDLAAPRRAAPQRPIAQRLGW